MSRSQLVIFKNNDDINWRPGGGGVNWAFIDANSIEIFTFLKSTELLDNPSNV